MACSGRDFLFFLGLLKIFLKTDTKHTLFLPLLNFQKTGNAKQYSTKIFPVPETVPLFQEFLGCK
jgi:hypothetical protein